ncbi:MAG: glycosyltransferase [Gilvibacter sp.]
MMIATVIIGLVYLATLLYFANGYKKVSLLTFKEAPPKVGFSIIIPFRNEDRRLQPLLASLLELSYPSELLEVLFIDDASTDDSVNTINTVLKHAPFSYRILKNQLDSQSPKKAAITLGISKAQFDWILTTDADCKLPDTWLGAFNAIINSESPDFIAAPVRFGIEPISGFLSHFAQNEAFAILVTTIGSYGHDAPILSNGANLAYKKVWFNQVRGFEGNNHIASGDDVFMLQKAIASDANIAYLKSPLAVVQTKTESSLKGFLSQRIRWASKTTAVKNRAATMAAAIIVLTNLWFLTLFVAIFFASINSWYFAIFAIFKMIVDLWYISKVDNVMSTVPSRHFGLVQIMYPLVILFVILGSLLGGYKWKGRGFKK